MSLPATGRLTRQDILDLPSVPAISPSYPHGPYRFLNREYFIITYETDRESLLSIVPDPLVPNPLNRVLYEWIAMPDSSGFGDYQESGVVIPCTLDGQEVNFVASMFLDCEPPIGCGREIWGFPKKRASPVMRVDHDTLVGTLDYASQNLATGTMAYKYQTVPTEEARKSLMKLQTCLKIIPGLGDDPEVAQLVGFNLCEVEVLGAWKGPARLHLQNSATAPLAMLPVHRVIEGKHILANLTLPYGRVLYDYLSQKQQPPTLPRQQQPAPSSTPVRFTEDRVRETPSMPAFAPSFPDAAPLITTKQGVVVVYQAQDVNHILPHLPQAIELLSDQVYLSVGSHEGLGVGAYSRCQIHVLVRMKGSEERFMYPLFCLADCSSLVTFGREKYGKPFKYGFPQLSVDKDTLVISVRYGSQEVIRGSMLYKHHRSDPSELHQILSANEIFLKFIPSPDGENHQVCQLVSSANENLKLDEVYSGQAALTFFPHVHAPFSDVPIKQIVHAYHYSGIHCQHPNSVLLDFLAPSRQT